ncbi:DsbE family thiol:disulfide interchange protein [Rhizobium ruizarguesonis]|uniref:DsbE family thiol:disulfide interchange protein n=1 Tax=Rhizobium leguminosarum TaxID=384 RepID=UPI00103A98E5|nr:DsbE family thiol:disulfide interchange protein [Rhizobium leguminosarum]MBY5494379.1 DsbE family thiol:disulfide interchange protein [Rhizobium leguminosarum]TBZ40342.1 DsbE family thiol:disulfide interchange protein [Rhizobium leguminosarum bv. viciae]TCA08931.1 DsbE family thiol:disulfide interchange protein [Rhizobium leguminosarum bv. viciae]TCA19526.1 DsbE family thiol:disulfide interchange protein [Rhizobium leguminosarum bv. viciae]
MRRYTLAAFPLVAFLGIAGAVANTLYRESAEGYSPSAIPSVLVGRRHPALDLAPLAGLNVPGLYDPPLDGHVTVVNIFASWCVPCRLEHPALVELAKDPRIKLVGINYKDAPGKALAFLHENGNPFAAVGTDENGRSSIDWGVYGVPETFVVDRAGRIVLRHVGPIDEKSLTMNIRPALEEIIAAE